MGRRRPGDNPAVFCHQPHVPVGGRLTGYLEHWRQITTDAWVLEVVEKGYALPFSGAPPSFHGLRKTRAPSAVEPVLASEIATLLAKGAIRQVRIEDMLKGHYSIFFTVPKKTGDLRAILNLKPLNKHLVLERFRFETLQQVIVAIQPGDWLATIDLKDAYLHVPVRKSHWKYLRFWFLGQAWECMVLMFGIKTAPKVFTKILAPVIASLRRQGILLYVYLDDILLRAPSRAALEKAIPIVIEALAKVGFVLNLGKSDLDPSQDLVYIGGRFKTDEGIVLPPQDRVEKLQSLLTQLRPGRVLSALFFLRCLGLMASMIAVVPLARLHMRHLQLFLLHHWRPVRDPLTMRLTVPESLAAPVDWWRNTANLFRGVPLVPPVPRFTVTTDASTSGWGGHLDSHEGVQGSWTPVESRDHINVLELLSVRKCLLHYLPFIRGAEVLVQSDNTTVVAYINKQGGTQSHTVRSCVTVVELVSRTPDRHRAVHLPGLTIGLADLLSRRRVNHNEWSLRQDVADRVFLALGRPRVDWFASRFNHKLQLYGSLYRDPHAQFLDAFQADWSQHPGYVFPPVKMLPRVLDKVRRDRATIVLVAPVWPRRLWYPDLLGMVVDAPRLLPLSETLLSQGTGPRVVYHPQPELLKLAAWKVSGANWRHLAFLQQLSAQSLPRDDQTLVAPMTRAGQRLSAGVLHGTWIPLLPL